MQRIDTKNLTEMQRQKDDLAIINVLSPEHFHHRHIPGSLNVPVTEADFAEKIESTVGDRDEPIVLYCANEECDASEKAAAKLDAAGFREVYDYAGGMAAWEKAGRPVQAGTHPGGSS
jgi:rhodanese-related sulfurtransferase